MGTFLRWTAKILKINWEVLLGDGSSNSPEARLQPLSRRRRKGRARPILEPLENRICPSVYDYKVIAQTDGQNVTGLGNGPSINDSGKVAFVEQFADGSSSIFAGDGSSPPTEVSATLRNQRRTFGSTVQINNRDAIAAVDRISGTPGQYWLRTWNADTRTYQIQDEADPGPTFDSFLDPVSINNASVVAYSGKLTGANTVILDRGGGPISSLPSPQLELNPMIADTNSVIARVDHDLTDLQRNPIELFVQGKPATVIASYPDFAVLGARPGISDDGQVVAFYGDLTQKGADDLNAAQRGPDESNPLHPEVTRLYPGRGIFVSLQAGSGRIIQRIAGITTDPYLSPGEVWRKPLSQANGPGLAGVKTNLAVDPSQITGGISNFAFDGRIGINLDPGPGALSGGQLLKFYKLVFVATAHDTDQELALFTSRIRQDGQDLFAPTPILKKGDSIPGFGVVEDFNLYDPINTKGQVVFWASTGMGAGSVQAIILGQGNDPVRQVTVPAGPALYAPKELNSFIQKVQQNPTAYPQDEPYLNGPNGLIEFQTKGNYSIFNRGCAIASLSMALDNLQIAELSPGQLMTVLDQQDGITPIKHIKSVSESGSFVFDGADLAWYKLSTIFPAIRETRINGSDTLFTLKVLAALHEGDQVVMQVKGSFGNHWILVVQAPDGTLRSIDPGHAIDPKGDLVTDLQDYTPAGTTGIVCAEILGLKVNQPGLLLQTQSPVQFVLTAPSGARLGFDPSTNTTYTEIAGGSYGPLYPVTSPDDIFMATDLATIDSLAPDQATASVVETGDYHLTVYGIAAGPFTIDSLGINGIGQTSTFTTTGTISAGQTLMYTFHLIGDDTLLAVTTNPTSQIVGDGISVAFLAAANANPTATVQWQVSTNGGRTFSDIASATAATLTFRASAAQSGNEYRAVFSNSAGSVTTTAATLTVATSPIVTTNPASHVVSAGNSVSFAAAAVGSPTPTVQWQVSTDGGNTFNAIAGATASTYTTTVSATQTGNEYRANFTNSSGSASTAPAFLTVNTTQGNLVISATTGVLPQFHLVAPPGSVYFGAQIVALSNGNLVATDPSGNGGAVYLFNGQTGVLISALTGLTSLGVGPTVTALANGNFVVSSPDWNNGMGAVTWGSGTTGVSGTVSAANSLVGSTVFDHVGGLGGAGGGITALANGNYVVDSPNWGSNGSPSNGRGAVTWGNGATGTSGVVSAANSLVGSSVFDQGGGGGGLGGVTALANGNYVVDSPYWGSDASENGPGAVTWGNGATGTSGIVSAANSLVGSTMGDVVGRQKVIALTNGNYVVDSPFWNGQKGAVTWGNGATGITGVVSAANSLVGSNALASVPDLVGSGGVTALTNGNYVVDSPRWSANTSTGSEIGAVTWGNGATGSSGPVSTANSLVGDKQGDSVGGGFLGGGVTALANGNYVVNSPSWGTTLSIDAGLGAIPLGAVTWENGTASATGSVNAATSLVGNIVGSTAANGVGSGGVTALTNGNYVVDSANWNQFLGAVTWGSGTTGITGTISAANSLVGTFVNDQIGGGSTNPHGIGFGVGGVFALSNGNYVVDSPEWQAKTGAVTWGNGTTGTSGTVSAANSLVGNAPGDEVGGSVDGGSDPSAPNGGGVTALTNGNYVVLTPSKATATWGNGTTGIRGTLSAAQSLGGVTGNVFGVNSLPNGNYVVTVNNARGNASDTWVNGATGSTLDGQNTIDAQNSLKGVAGAVPLFGGSAFLATDAFAGMAAVGVTDPSLLTYALAQGQTISITPDFLTRTLNAGTDVTLQANDDIIVNSPITENPTGTAGSLTLQAGRSIILNANINTGGGDLTLIANDTLADGVVNSERDPGNAVITEQSGATINTGAGALTVDLKDSTDKTNNGRGGVTLPGVTGSETLSSSTTVNISINGITPGDGIAAGSYTQLNVTGSINLNGAALSVIHSVATDRGAIFTIVHSTAGVSGKFGELNEGATVVAADGTRFTISYQGSGGKDVVLTQVSDSTAPTPTLAFSTASASFHENSGAATVTVLLNNGGTNPVTVQYAVSISPALKTKQQAVPGLDFTGALTGTLLFAAGQTQQTITFPLPNPQLVEEDKFFTVTLSSPTAGAVLGSPAVTSVDILDDNLPLVANATPKVTTLQNAALGFGTSLEHYQQFVTTAYAQYLGRVPAAFEVAYWVSLMQAYETTNHQQGLRQEQVEAGFLDSQEYLGRYGGVGKAWIDGIYHDLLGRAPDPMGESYWLAQLAGGADPTQVALGFTTSLERLRNRVTGIYQNLLERAPDTYGLNYWVALFQGGGTTEEIVSGFVGSVEYYNRADGAAGNPARWIREAYLDVLFRPAHVSEMSYWLNFLQG
jgi:hypothetical protein